MANSFQNQAPTSHEVVSEEITVLQLDGFISELRPTSTSTTPLFVSLDAFRASGTCVYTLDAEQRRVYLPSQFIASIHKVEVVEREYAGNYEAYTKLCLSMTVGQKLYTLFVGLNSWAGQSLLNSLGQLTEAQLHSPLFFKAVAGRRTCFFRIALDTGEGEWMSVSISDEALGTRLNTDELILLANTIDETLSSTN